jgi:hypothetical protein
VAKRNRSVRLAVLGTLVLLPIAELLGFALGLALLEGSNPTRDLVGFDHEVVTQLAILAIPLVPGYVLTLLFPRLTVAVIWVVVAAAAPFALVGSAPLWADPTTRAALGVLSFILILISPACAVLASIGVVTGVAVHQFAAITFQRSRVSE